MSFENLPDYPRYGISMWNKINNNGNIKQIGLKEEMFDSKTKLVHFIKTNTAYYHRIKIVVFPYVNDDDNELVLFDGLNPYFKKFMFPKALANELI